MLKSFTMSEVLITLGIIGIVAAMTLPSAIQNYQKKIVETRLAKFYSIYNQAILAAEARFGDRQDWYDDSNNIQLDPNGEPIEGTSSVDKWFQYYLSDFIVLKKKVYRGGQVRYYLSDGSAFQYGMFSGTVKSSRGLLFIPSGSEKCDVSTEALVKANVGVCAFYFLYDPKGLYSPLHKNKGLEPTMYGWNGTRKQLLDGCRTRSNNGYCTTLIKYDGWKISKDYPKKVHL